MDQEQTMLYEPLGELREVREVGRNVMKPVDENTFPTIFLTVRPTPRCAVKQAHKVQDQCKSKPSLPARPRPAFCSGAPLQPCHAARASLPSLLRSEDNLMLFILWKGTLLWDVRKTQQHQLALNSAGSLSLPTMQPERGQWGVLCWRGWGSRGASWQEVKSSWERGESDGRLLKILSGF